MRTIQDLVPTNVNMYRVASNRKRPKPVIKKKMKGNIFKIIQYGSQINFMKVSSAGFVRKERGKVY
jgi:hypothetical protein